MSFGKTLSERIIGRAVRHGHRPFLAIYDHNGSRQSLTYEGFCAVAQGWHACYDELGLPPRSRILIVLYHSLDVYAAFVGALLSNHIPSILSHPSPKQDVNEYLAALTRLVTDAKPAAVVTYPEFNDRLRTLLHGLSFIPQLIVPTQVSCAGEPLRSELPSPAAHPDDIAFIQYSSGTTGLKKAVGITHEAALWQIDNYATAIDLSDSDSIATWLPLYHDMGLVACTLLPLVKGTPTAAMSPFDWVRRPVSLLEVISRHRASLCWLPNFAYTFLARNAHDDELIGLDLRSVRGLINSSELIMAESHDLFLARFAHLGLTKDVLKTSYAMAENVFAVTSGGFGAPLVRDIVRRDLLAQGIAEPTTADDPRARTLVSSGTPLPSTGIRILSSNGSAAHDRHIGEIVISSPCLFERYQSGHQAEMMGRHFLTGDMGYLAGQHLFVTGRKSDTIIVAGKNISPEELESAASEVPGVVPGRVVAFGVANESTGTEDVVVVAETRETCGERLASITDAIRQSVASRADVSVDHVRLVAHMWLRKSSSGKLSRAANRRRYIELVGAQEHLPSHIPHKQLARSEKTFLAAEPTSRWLSIAVEVTQRVLGSRLPRNYGPDYRLVASGQVDSLTLVALVMELEHVTGLRIPPSFLDVGHFKTARHIARLLESAAAGEGPLAHEESAKAVSLIDDRDRACEQLAEAGDAIDLLILGSSKARPLSPSVARLHGFNAFNFWLANAHAEDWYCALQFVLHETRAALQTVVLLMDVEAFSNKAKIDIRLAHSRHLRPYLRLTDGWTLPALDGHALPLSDRRFDVVLRQFQIGYAEPWMLRLRSDHGSPRVWIEGNRVAERPPVLIADANERNDYYRLKMKGFHSLDQRRMWYFRELLQACFDRHLKVICGVSPLHHALDTFLASQTTYADRLGDLKTVILSIQHPLLVFHDTRSPARFNGFEDDFLDGAHIGEANADRLLEHLLSTSRTR